jgi:thiamine biosynthesis protein ThiI
MREVYIFKHYNLIKINPSPEIWLKSIKVRMRMVNILIQNIKKKFIHTNIIFHKYQLTKDNARILFFFSNEFIKSALNSLDNVIGIESFSPALRTSNKINNIIQRTTDICREVLQKGDTFAVRVKRSGNHEYTSHDVAVKVGQAILDNFTDLNLKVNLTNPKKKIFIEIRDEFSYIFTDIIKSRWGGLPIEDNKKVICMDIGRLNDFLAGFLIMRRGCVLYPILFKINEDENTIKKWILNWKEIMKYTPYSILKFRIINVVDILKVIEKDLKERAFFCAICRMIRFEILGKILNGSNFGEIERIKAITDGVSLNGTTYCTDEVDLESIALNHLFLNLPIFTPVIGLDSQNINKYLSEISINLNSIDYCCFKPKSQQINTEEIKKLYKSLKIDNLINQCINKIEEFNVS